MVARRRRSAGQARLLPCRLEHELQAVSDFTRITIRIKMIRRQRQWLFHRHRSTMLCTHLQRKLVTSTTQQPWYLRITASMRTILSSNWCAWLRIKKSREVSLAAPREYRLPMPTSTTSPPTASTMALKQNKSRSQEEYLHQRPSKRTCLMTTMENYFHWRWSLSQWLSLVARSTKTLWISCLIMKAPTTDWVSKSLASKIVSCLSTFAVMTLMSNQRKESTSLLWGTCLSSNWTRNQMIHACSSTKRLCWHTSIRTNRV